jgi:glyoxylase-like metal-dependent hydrolase (beta-lactamase superfamily II)
VGNINAQNETEVQVEKINDSFYKFTLTTNFSVNMLMFTGPDGILLIDTGMPGITEQVGAKIKEISDKEIKYIINTHHHADHFSGNQLLGSQAVIIAHKNFYTTLTTGVNILQEYSTDILPQITFDNELDLYFNGENIKLVAMPGTHSNSDIIVYFPKSNIACLSAIVTPDNFPFVNIAERGSVKNFDKILNYFLTTFNDETLFIIGHGQNCRLSDIRNFINMINETFDLVSKEITSGKTVEQIQQEDILKNWESWGQGFVSKNLWIQQIANSINPPPAVNKESVAIPMFYTMKEKGIEAAIQQYETLKNSNPDKYDFREFSLNLFGYSLLGKNNFEDAIEIFKLNIKNFPESANVYDSLGEAYERSGDNDKALANYKKAVQNAEKINDPNLNIFKQNLERLQK